MTVPTPDRDPEYRSELLGYFQEAMDRHERNKQQALGPSEIGGCPRGIAWKLSMGAADGSPNGWAAHKGTVMHDWADKEVFAGKAPRFMSNLSLPQVVPWVAGGTLDLYDVAKKTVIDFKFPGDPSIIKARRGKPPEGYYVQVNTYALGLIKMGHPVDRVALFYGPMCGDDLHGEAKGAVLLTWPVNLQVAADHLRQVKQIQDSLKTSSLAEVMESLPTTDDFCMNRPCWTGNRHPQAICHGHRKSGAKLRNPENPYS